MRARQLRKAGEPSRLVAALPRRGRAPAPTPAGLEPRRQGERGRHLGAAAPGPASRPVEGRPPPPARAARQGAPPRQARTHGRRPSSGRDEGRRSRRRAPARAARRCGARASFAPRARRSTPLVDVHLEHTRRPRGREWRRGDTVAVRTGQGSRPGIARAGAASNRSTTARIIARLSRRGGAPAGPCRSANLARRPRRRMRSRPCLTRSPEPLAAARLQGRTGVGGTAGVGRGRAEGYVS